MSQQTDSALEAVASDYATEQGFPRKGRGVGYESFTTLMKYEVRDYIIEAVEFGVDWAVRHNPRVLALVKALQDIIPRNVAGNQQWGPAQEIAGRALTAWEADNGK